MNLKSQKTYSFNKKEIPVLIVQKKNMKHMNIRINKDFIIQVNVSKYFSTAEIDKFVLLNLSILQKKIIELKQSSLFNFKTQFIFLFGQKQKYTIQKTQTKYKVIFPELKTYFIKNTSHQEMIKLRNRFLKDYLLLYLKERQKYFENLMQLSTHQYKAIFKSTTWGTIKPFHAKINYNSQLAYFPSSAIDYVIVHELSHNFYSNHGKAFWKQVIKFCPNYKVQKRILSKKISLLDN